jgi:pilus assembly protein CpaC
VGFGALFKGCDRVRTRSCCSRLATLPWLLLWVSYFMAPPFAAAQQAGDSGRPSRESLVVRRQVEDLTMIINSSCQVTLEAGIVRADLHDDKLLSIVPVSADSLLLQAKATGVTQVDLHTEGKQVFTVRVMVIGDARELQGVLAAEFPTSVINVRPIEGAVILSGEVHSDVHVEQIVAIAEQYYPKIINKIGVRGVPHVLLKTRVMEVSRTKLRELGIDWGFTTGQSYGISGSSGLTAFEQGLSPISAAGAAISSGVQPFHFGVIRDNSSFFGLINALEQNSLIKVMADPTTVALDGRPATFSSGGEFPILVPQGLGQVSVEYRQYGTRVDFMAKVRSNGWVLLEVRPVVSEVDPTRSVTIQGNEIPALRSRSVETSAEVQVGQTLAIAGLLQSRTETITQGLPVLGNLPYIGAMFRRTRDVHNEVELLMTITPEFVAAMDPHQVPWGGPGYNTGSPTNHELYWKGYTEVPATCVEPECPPGWHRPTGVVGSTMSAAPTGPASPPPGQWMEGQTYPIPAPAGAETTYPFPVIEAASTQPLRR